MSYECTCREFDNKDKFVLHVMEVALAELDNINRGGSAEYAAEVLQNAYSILIEEGIALHNANRKSIGQLLIGE